ncbi:MAG: transporter substrate-binding domain-containing protein, partial [Rhodomicrobium sp.]
MLKAYPWRILAFFCAVLLFPLTASAETLHLRIATEGANPPFSTIDSNGNLEGFDVDIANAL